MKDNFILKKLNKLNYYYLFIIITILIFIVGCSSNYIDDDYYKSCKLENDNKKINVDTYPVLEKFSLKNVSSITKNNLV
jgi:hypothetical protein